jgi:hypothetical protein
LGRVRPSNEFTDEAVRIGQSAGLSKADANFTRSTADATQDPCADMLTKLYLACISIASTGASFSMTLAYR